MIIISTNNAYKYRTSKEVHSFDLAKRIQHLVTSGSSLKITNKMKYLVLAILVVTSQVQCSPISINDNNIGDIVNVGVNIEADIKNDIDANIISVIVALLLQTDGISIPPLPPLPTLPTLPTGTPTVETTIGTTTTPITNTTPIGTTTTTQGTITTTQAGTTTTQAGITTTQGPITTSIAALGGLQVDDIIAAVQQIKERASTANLTKEQKEQIWREHAEQFVQSLHANKH